MKFEKYIYLKWLPAILFSVAIALHILVVYYQDMIYTVHLRTPFIGGGLFFDEVTSCPFGIMRWVGCWFSQFCYYPLLGTFILVAIWTATYFVADKVFNLPSKWISLLVLPLGCLLLSVVDLGYWIYCLTEYGYFFSHSLAYLLMFLLLWVTRKSLKSLPNSKIASIVLIDFVLILLYPILGWYLYLFAAILAILEWKRFGVSILWLLVASVLPLFWGFYYDNISTRDLWIGGFPLFEDGVKLSIRPSIPFIALIVFSIAIAFLSSLVKHHKDEKWIHSAIVTLIVSIVTFLGVWQMMFKDYNFLAEMRMSKCAMEDDWRGVLEEAQKQKSPSRSMVLLKNVALMHTGGLGEYGFKFSSNGQDIKNPDKLNISSMQIVCPIVYNNYGKINYASRWANEFAVCYGYSPFYLMNLIRSANAKGESNLVEKYSSLLHSHLFYNDWKPKELPALSKSLERDFGNVIDSDNNNGEYYLIDTFSQSYGSDDPLVVELSLFYAMLYGNSERFWNAFVSYASLNLDRVLPQHYQEAFFIFMEVAPVELSNNVKLSKGMDEAYTSFRRQYDALSQQGYSMEDIGKALKIKWGGSYWWHYFFGRKTY